MLKYLFMKINTYKFFIILTLLFNFSLNSQTVYYWNGSVNSVFSTAGNWTPLRQVGLVTDILIFENTGSIYVTGVNQVTIGQLIVRNNTNLTLTPGSGNSRVITIRGGDGADLLIEQGSSLRIQANDPALNLYIGAGATAEIYGNLKFEGNIACYINSAEQNSIYFKAGSKLEQNSPGYVFGTSGVNNAVIFEAGSECVINHSNALNPFGLAAPNSKVQFASSSKLKLNAINSFQLNGRNLGDLEIGSGLNLNIQENFTSDISIENLKILNSAVLNLKNLNPQYTPSIIIKGDVIVNGAFSFSDDNNSKFNIVLSGTNTQKFSGSGQIIIPQNLNRFELQNNILLERNLTVNCPIFINRYEIIKNGYEFYYNPFFGNPFERNKTITSSGSGKFSTISASGINNSNIPDKYSISQNYPNPFNPSTKIDFSLPEDTKVTIIIYDITGKAVKELINGEFKAGYYNIGFSSENLSSGIYFYTITAGSKYSKTLKMVLTK